MRTRLWKASPGATDSVAIGKSKSETCSVLACSDNVQYRTGNGVVSCKVCDEDRLYGMANRRPEAGLLRLADGHRRNPPASQAQRGLGPRRRRSRGLRKGRHRTDSCPQREACRTRAEPARCARREEPASAQGPEGRTDASRRCPTPSITPCTGLARFTRAPTARSQPSIQAFTWPANVASRNLPLVSCGHRTSPVERSKREYQILQVM